MSPCPRFLEGSELRPWKSSKARAPQFRGYALGTGDAALQVLVGDTAMRPRQEDVRAIWKERNAGKPFPLLVVVLYGDSAALCGPGGEDPPAYLDLDVGQVERVCLAALSLPDRHSALRYLSSTIPGLEGPSPGIRNEGLFASHELQTGVLDRHDWNAATTKSKKVLEKRGKSLLMELGYSIEPMAGPVSLLKVGEKHIAVAVFLEQGESPDMASTAYSELSPVSYALARADERNIPYVIIESGSTLRIHATDPAAGVGRRGRTDTFFEIQLDLLPDSQAGYLWLFFGGDSLLDGQAVQQILDSSSRFSSDLGSRLRDRVYADVVPQLAGALVKARRLRKLDVDRLRETYEATLFLLFRILFIAYAEDRDLLPYRTNGLYRRRSLKSIAADLLEVHGSGGTFGEDPELWGQLCGLFRAVRNGNGAWGVPAYDGGLFSDDPDVSELGALLETIDIPDSRLGPILSALLLDDNPEGVGPVDFRSLGVREFGTIYEGLLESELSQAEQDLTTDRDGVYRPCKKNEDALVPEGGVYLHNASGARKSSGSYFTKHFAVEHLIDRALEPALAEHLERLDAVADDLDAGERFFDFRVADIAMGSGHFLIAAVDHIERRLAGYLSKRALPVVAEELASLRTAAHTALGSLAEQVTIEDTQLLRRLIARRCIYGVDLNPTAVQLARLSVWIHTFVPGLPLSLLDHNLVIGNSLVGIARLSEVREKVEEGNLPMFAIDPEHMLGDASDHLARLGRIADATPADLQRARKAHKAAEEAVAASAALLDIVTASRIESEPLPVDVGAWETLKETIADSEEHRLALDVLADLCPFHFPVAFPEVFLRGRAGFDVVLGNPPWEKARVEEHAFWARHQPGLRGLTQRQREAEIRRLRKERPDLVEILDAEVEEAEVLRLALTTGPYPGMGTGDPDLYKAFSWRFWHLVHDEGGRIGVVLPRSVLSAMGSTKFRLEVLDHALEFDITTLQNTKGWVFDDAEYRYTIGLICIERRDSKRSSVRLRGPYPNADRYRAGMIREPAVFYGSEVKEWNDTASLPLLPSVESVQVLSRLRKSPRLDIDDGLSWRARPYSELHATNDKKHMDVVSKTCPDGFWPVYKGESFDIWQPDTGQHYAWADPDTVLPILQEKRLRSASRKKGSPFVGFHADHILDPETLPCLRPRIAFRDVTNRTNRRTVVVALVPSRVFLNHVAPFLLMPRSEERDTAYLLGVLSSLPLDWYARRFVETHLTFFVLNPFPVPRPGRDDGLRKRVVALAGRLAAADDRFADWAKAVGVEWGTLSEDQEQDHIHELDAVVAHLYGLRQKHVVHIFETFHEGWDHEERLRSTLKHFREWKAKL